MFGSALAAEGIFAFFLESGFLALLIFGWDRVGKKTHFLATVMVALGSAFSAVWIVVANSWMQAPDGYHIVTGPTGVPRAEVVDFWRVVLNPSTVNRLWHGDGGVAGGGVTGDQRFGVLPDQAAARGICQGIGGVKGRAHQSCGRAEPDRGAIPIKPVDEFP